MNRENVKVSILERFAMAIGSLLLLLISTPNHSEIIIVIIAVIPWFWLMTFLVSRFDGQINGVWFLTGNVVVSVAILISFWWLIPSWRYATGIVVATLALLWIAYLGYLRGIARP